MKTEDNYIESCEKIVTKLETESEEERCANRRPKGRYPGGASRKRRTITPSSRFQSRTSNFIFGPLNPVDPIGRAGLITTDDCFVQKSKDKDDQIERCYKRYSDMLSILPKEKGWVSEFMVNYEGFWFQPNFGFEGLMWSREHFKARHRDVFLISTPKSDTTWLKALAFSIINRKKFDFSSHPLLTHSPHQLVPFLELKLFMSLPIGDPEVLPSPRILASHIPYSLLPPTIIDSGCKIVYICRNPKDVFVSMWHFMSLIRVDGHAPLSLEEGFDLFCKGISSYGPFWDQALEYWKASLKFPDRVLFLKYEDMKENTLLHLKTLANFLGQAFTKEEEENGVIQEIVKLCSFESMRTMEVNKNGTYRAHLKNNIFFRKGEIGDWTNYLTPEMSNRLEQITEYKLEGSGLVFNA